MNRDRGLLPFWIGFGLAALVALRLMQRLRAERWLEPGPLAPGAINLGPPPGPAPAIAGPAATPPADPLEQINGIGAVYARRLNQAGVHTFNQLAALSSDELRAITGARRWDPAEWIGEARRLAGQS
ncbi:MAG: helix-hairpin-helix domain-containing protein [Candidatus Promineifilaceae bacterium]